MDPGGRVLPTAAGSEPLSPAAMNAPRPVEHQGGRRTSKAGVSGGWAAPKHQNRLPHDKHGETPSVHTKPPKTGAYAPIEKHTQALGISAIRHPPWRKKLVILVQIVWACLAGKAQVLAGRKQDLLQSCCLSVRVPKCKVQLGSLVVFGL